MTISICCAKTRLHSPASFVSGASTDPLMLMCIASLLTAKKKLNHVIKHGIDLSRHRCGTRLRLDLDRCAVRDAVWAAPFCLRQCHRRLRGCGETPQRRRGRARLMDRPMDHFGACHPLLTLWGLHVPHLEIVLRAFAAANTYLMCISRILPHPLDRNLPADF